MCIWGADKEKEGFDHIYPKYICQVNMKRRHIYLGEGEREEGQAFNMETKKLHLG
jgi:hypothetical protein